jgi:hypothetical protein
MNGPFQNQSSELASYDATDLAEGTGSVEYHGIAGAISGAATYSLIPFKKYSADYAITPGTSTFNFDLGAYNMPRTIKGTAYIACAIYVGNPGGGYFSVQFQKVSGSTTTNVSEKIYSPTSAAGSGASYYFMKIPMIQTSFGVGDYLRMVLIGGTTGSYDLLIEPLDPDPLTASMNTADFSVTIPYRLDNL